MRQSARPTELVLWDSLGQVLGEWTEKREGEEGEHKDAGAMVQGVSWRVMMEIGKVGPRVIGQGGPKFSLCSNEGDGG